MTTNTQEIIADPKFITGLETVDRKIIELKAVVLQHTAICDSAKENIDNNIFDNAESTLLDKNNTSEKKLYLLARARHFIQELQDNRDETLGADQAIKIAKACIMLTNANNLRTGKQLGYTIKTFFKATLRKSTTIDAFFNNSKYFTLGCEEIGALVDVLSALASSDNTAKQLLSTIGKQPKAEDCVRLQRY